jgi:hypothetical protein
MISCGKRACLLVAGGANRVAASQPLAVAATSDGFHDFLPVSHRREQS